MSHLPCISKRSVFRSLFAISVSNTFLQVFGFIFRILLSRKISAEALGVYQLLMPFYSVLLSLTVTGLTVAVARLSAYFKERGDICGARASLFRARRLFFVFFFFVCLLVFFFSDFISDIVLGDRRASLALFPLLICLLLTGVENIFKHFFYGTGKVFPQIVSELSEQIVRAIAVLSILSFFVPDEPGSSAFFIFTGMVISEIVSVIILSLFFHFNKGKKTTEESSAPRYMKILSISLPVSFAAIANNILASANASLIPAGLKAGGMSACAATENFGVMFGMTMPLLSFPIAFIASLTSVMVPRVSETLANKDIFDLRRKAGKTIHVTSLIAMPCMALLMQLGSPLCLLLWKNPDAGAYLFPLCIATLFSYYEITTGALLNGIGAEKEAAAYIIFSGIVQLVFTLAVPYFGLGAFVFGYIVSSFLASALNLICLIRKTKLRLRFSNWFLRPLIASTVCFFITGIAFFATSSLIISLLAGIFSYLVSLNALGTSFIRYIKTIIPKNRC